VEWNLEDSLLIQREQLSRFEDLLPIKGISVGSLPDGSLHLTCSFEDESDRLLRDEKLLKECAWVVMGCYSVHIWVGEAEVWASPTRPEFAEPLPEGCELLRLSPEELESISYAIDLEESIMPTATADKPATSTAKQPKTSPKLATNLPGQSIATIANTVMQSPELVLGWVTERGMQIIPFGDSQIISGQDAIATYRHFSSMICDRWLESSGLLDAANLTPPELNGTNGSSPEPATEKPVRNTRSKRTGTTANAKSKTTRGTRSKKTGTTAKSARSSKKTAD
jgi:hypothetical protein